ncbi:iron-sulfur cluster insertion protein ErpA [Rickettsiales bacterium]|nr:iron-sulfur cluster insertion protein ErpA [Rickettsiales bacterium]
MTDNGSNFKVTDSAAKRIGELLAEEEDKSVKFRITVLGGGCSGFQYNFDFSNEKNDDDHVFANNGIEVLIDDTSMEFLDNSQIDYVQTLGSAAFVISNPNTTAECGCGNSFSV